MIGLKNKLTAVITWVELTFDKAQWEEEGNNCLPFGVFPIHSKKKEKN